jgi:hypothetical protein
LKKRYLWNTLLHQVFDYCAQHMEMSQQWPGAEVLDEMVQDVIRGYQETQQRDIEGLQVESEDIIWLKEAYLRYTQGEGPPYSLV